MSTISKNPSAPSFNQVAAMNTPQLIIALHEAQVEIDRIIDAIEDTVNDGRSPERLESVLEYWIVAFKRITQRIKALKVIDALQAAAKYVEATDQSSTATDEQIGVIEDAFVAAFDGDSIAEFCRMITEVNDDINADDKIVYGGVTRDAVAARLLGKITAA